MTNPRSPLTALVWDVRDPTHCSIREGNGIPGIMVCYYFYTGGTCWILLEETPANPCKVLWVFVHGIKHYIIINTSHYLSFRVNITFTTFLLESAPNLKWIYLMTQTTTRNRVDVEVIPTLATISCEFLGSLFCSESFSQYQPLILFTSLIVVSTISRALVPRYCL